MNPYISSIYALACVFNTYVFQLALEVSKVITEAPVLRQQLSVLSILGAQSRLNFPPLAQRICQITLLLLVPEGGEQSEELCTVEIFCHIRSNSIQISACLKPPWSLIF